MWLACLDVSGDEDTVYRLEFVFRQMNLFPYQVWGRMRPGHWIRAPTSAVSASDGPWEHRSKWHSYGWRTERRLRVKLKHEVLAANGFTRSNAEPDARRRQLSGPVNSQGEGTRQIAHVSSNESQVCSAQGMSALFITLTCFVCSILYRNM